MSDRLPKDVQQRLTRIRDQAARRYPNLGIPQSRKPRATRAKSANLGMPIYLGKQADQQPMVLHERLALEHCHFLGASGGGKTNALEWLCRQIIENGRGLMLIDPHGGHPDSLYRRLLAWTDERGLIEGRTVHVVDPNAPDYTVGFNPLRLPDQHTHLSVVADTTLEAIEQVWQQDMHDKPTIQSILTATFTALAELGLTLAEAKLLYAPDDPHGVRAVVLDRLQDPYAHEEFARLHAISQDPRLAREFLVEVVGARNRLNDFLRSDAVRTILGQTERVLDLREAMDEGHIILVNLQDGQHASHPAMRVLGTLLLRYTLFFAGRRRRPEQPFFVAIDECHNVLSGDLTRLLPEARKFGVGLMLSHQFLHQLRDAGESIYEAVRSTARVKLVFGLASPDEAEDVARDVIPLDFEVPKESMIRPVQTGHRVTQLRSVSEGTNESDTDSESTTEAEAHGNSFSEFEGLSASEAAIDSQVLSPEIGWLHGAEVISETAGTVSATNNITGASAATSRSRSTSQSRGKAKTRGKSHSKGHSEAIEPVYERLPTELYTKDELLYLAAHKLRTLAPGEAYVAFRDKAGLLHVPLMPKITVSDDAFASLRAKVMAASPSAIPIADAEAVLEDRRRTLTGQAVPAGMATGGNDDDEPEDDDFYQPYSPPDDDVVK
ncbi:MAG: type IV secretory system conjugative DNA transfer family protein [bacterium]